ncbi:hypothetical protein ISN45_At03g047570 [Arabidopsis thaliana x Arabidopsis arenosa]|uniref:Uncharacterized protein n=2 Tax=Arabidopsis TaxID=3701 RepID=A0A8T2FT07_ARASU|nr:hypothetical protein ISN45_At03g047570 [Arabidopsis thaliana x Arabidopsis arenosa]KAG7634441.1 hypothetical protein ISN44_As03g046480 [Arabidopsis suecica]
MKKEPLNKPRREKKILIGDNNSVLSRVSDFLNGTSMIYHVQNRGIMKTCE